MKINVKFISEVNIKSEKNLLKAAKDAKIKLNDSCDGKGKCGKCIIKVISGKLSEPTKAEIKELGEEKLKKGYRLACQVEALEDVVIENVNN